MWNILTSMKYMRLKIPGGTWIEMINVWEMEIVVCETRSFNQGIPLVNTSEIFQKDTEVISCSGISRMHTGIKCRDLESSTPGSDFLPHHFLAVWPRELPNPTKPKFSHLQNGDNYSTYLLKIKYENACEALSPVPRCGKCSITMLLLLPTPSECSWQHCSHFSTDFSSSTTYQATYKVSIGYTKGTQTHLLLPKSSKSA